MWRPRCLDAPTVVDQLAVDCQREVVLWNDLVMIADVRHGDEVVCRHLPASLIIPVNTFTSSLRSQEEDIQQVGHV